MHPHLHTKDNIGCADLMAALEECHERGFMHKLFGGCNATKTEVNKCLRAERLKRTAKNREESRERNRKVRERWRGIEEES